MPNISDTISTYILAKDTNRPWLMKTAFDQKAQLTIDIKTDAIAFPSIATGLNEITETLVRRFTSENENIYTFCLTDVPTFSALQFACNWLVGMTRKDTGEIRVGCGRYEWTFSDQTDLLACDLRITIEVMVLLGQEHVQSIMRWLSDLPYPWCPIEAALQCIPRLKEIAPIADFLELADEI